MTAWRCCCVNSPSLDQVVEVRSTVYRNWPLVGNGAWSHTTSRNVRPSERGTFGTPLSRQPNTIRSASVGRLVRGGLDGLTVSIRVITVGLFGLSDDVRCLEQLGALPDGNSNGQPTSNEPLR